MGATRAINVGDTTIDETMSDLGMVEGFDVGMEMSGNPHAFRDMLRTMHHGGKVALLGRMILDFSDRVLELDATPSAVMFADSKLLTDDEIDELERLLKSEGGEQ